MATNEHLRLLEGVLARLKRHTPDDNYRLADLDGDADGDGALLASLRKMASSLGMPGPPIDFVERSGVTYVTLQSPRLGDVGSFTEIRRAKGSPVKIGREGVELKPQQFYERITPREMRALRCDAISVVEAWIEFIRDREAKATQSDSAPVADVKLRLLSTYLNQLVDERFVKACEIVESDSLKPDQKLWKLDALMPIPPTVSAQKLGNLLGCSKPNIQKTSWYKEHRKSEPDNQIARREQTSHSVVRKSSIESDDD